MRRLWLLFALPLVVSCSDSDPGTPCLVNSDCETTARCVNGGCVPRDLRDGSAAVDAPLADAPGTDAEICGMPCDTGNPCAAGAFDCASGTPICVGIGPAENSTQCRESLGECDPAEMCDGTSTECPTDVRAEVGSTCRAADGECDVAETCDGASPVCPFDVFELAGSECAEGLCDGAGVCSDGCVTGAPCQPADPCRTGTLNCVTDPATCVVAGNTEDGVRCGPSIASPFGPCERFSGECDESGTQTQSIVDNECVAGECTGVSRPVQRACSRPTEGIACTPRATNTCARCGSGTCVDFISCAPGNVCCGLTCASSCPRR